MVLLWPLTSCNCVCVFEYFRGYISVWIVFFTNRFAYYSTFYLFLFFFWKCVMCFQQLKSMVCLSIIHTLHLFLLRLYTASILWKLEFAEVKHYFGAPVTLGWPMKAQFQIRTQGIFKVSSFIRRKKKSGSEIIRAENMTLL